jgi:hypothetical protein
MIELRPAANERTHSTTTNHAIMKIHALLVGALCLKFPR